MATSWCGAIRCVSAVNPTMSDWNMHVCGRFQASVVGVASAEESELELLS